MSVVNQMLLELDRRHAGGADRAGLPSAVRALPPLPRGLPRRTLLLAAAGLLAIAGVAVAWPLRATLSPKVNEVQAEPLAMASTSTAAGGKEADQPEVIASLPADAPVSEPQLKAALELAMVPLEPPRSPAPQRVSKPLTPVSSATASTPAPQRAPAQAVAAAQSSAPQPVPAAPVPVPAASEIPIPQQASAETPANEDASSRIEIRPAGMRATVAGAVSSSAAGAKLKEARALAQRGELKAAADLLKAHAAAGASLAEYRGLHAAVLQRLTLHEAAVDEYRAALRLAPENAVWWMGLALSLEAQGRGREARSAYERARAGRLDAELAAFVDQKLAAP